MKTLFRHFLAAIASGSLLLTFETRAEILTNGDFELFTAGIPNGWTYTQGDGPATLSSSVVSPFHNVYPVSTTSVLLTDGTTTSGRPLLEQTISPASGIVHFSMDFLLSSLTGNRWDVNFGQSFNISVLTFRIDDAGAFSLVDFDGPFLYPLVQTNWYQVSFDLNFSTRLYSGSITPASSSGGIVASWSDRRVLSFGRTNIVRIRFTDNVLPGNSELYVDNVTIQVPEPALISLSVLIPMILAARWRKG